MTDSARPTLAGSPLGSPGDEQTTGRAVRDMFVSVAPRYDFLNHFLSAGRDIAWRKATARALRGVLERPGSLAVDVCCGTGDLAVQLSRYSAGHVVGADFCHPMLERARQKVARAPLPVVFVEADAMSLPFAGNSLDVITTAFGFRNLSNYARGLGELHRVLKPGGMLAILEFSRIHLPVIGPLFRFYFRRILPRIGTLLSGVSGPYQYLPDSVARFPDQLALAALMREAGFTNVHYRNFFLGSAALHLGQKA
ncbi:MAG TPA: bifunctional demethylmenaquinone methyltransferase/2-methoxy-6-polyprenyl-1,4-benzoquinol methylase UbiE [Terriglobia bacterium]|nr:bifunctional demethylmenaquinone methyltransferase/2-methoxy-6-polyprenyl-1,4-benzoquinol methylase UbiE [Terriglobia bacterium]